MYNDTISVDIHNCNLDFCHIVIINDINDINDIHEHQKK